MGARITYVFNDGTDHAVALYSHWGADGWQSELAEAIAHASPRLGDTSYWTRMVICSLINQAYGEDLMSETGFGIFAVSPNDQPNLWATEVVTIDLVNNTVEGVPFNTFCEYGVGV